MFDYFFGGCPFTACEENTLPVAPPLIETDELAAWHPSTFCVVETGRECADNPAANLPQSVFWPVDALMTPDFRLRTDPAWFADLLSRSGITPQTWVVCSFADDKAGWAAWLFWILTSFGHARTLILNGGAAKWRTEARPLFDTATPEPTNYLPPARFAPEERVFLPEVRDAAQSVTPFSPLLLDARTATEFYGEHFLDASPQPGECAGHIPGAVHFPYTDLLQADKTYKPVAELSALCETRGVSADRSVITYCAVGIRSATLWFALRHLLNFSCVRNYDGSWNEWNRTETNS